MNCSFVITFCNDRLPQLWQCLRLLHRNEPDLMDQETVLVCQDKCVCVPTPFRHTTLLNLKLDTYNRPLMINSGVRESKSEVIVLLDGDRILPENYFKTVTNSLEPGAVVTTEKMRRIIEDVSDEDLITGNFDSHPDDRSITNEFMMKNLFSGNVVMWREDYWRCGGMDESLYGYGFNDNDMTHNVISNGLKPQFRPEIELHLNHPRDFRLEGEAITHTRIMAAINCNRFCQKWKLDPPELHAFNMEMLNKLHLYPEHLQQLFLRTSGLFKSYL